MDQDEMSNIYRGLSMLLTKFPIICPGGFREKAVLEIDQ
jgi:hypothetical protein